MLPQVLPLDVEDNPAYRVGCMFPYSNRRSHDLAEYKVIPVCCISAIPDAVLKEGSGVWVSSHGYISLPDCHSQMCTERGLYHDTIPAYLLYLWGVRSLQLAHGG